MQQMINKCCVSLGKKFGSFDWGLRGVFGCFMLCQMQTFSELPGATFSGPAGRLTVPPELPAPSLEQKITSCLSKD